jgi:hypothetical protein
VSYCGHGDQDSSAEREPELRGLGRSAVACIPGVGRAHDAGREGLSISLWSSPSTNCSCCGACPENEDRATLVFRVSSPAVGPPLPSQAGGNCSDATKRDARRLGDHHRGGQRGARRSYFLPGGPNGPRSAPEYPSNPTPPAARASTKAAAWAPNCSASMQTQRSPWSPRCQRANVKIAVRIASSRVIRRPYPSGRCKHFSGRPRASLRVATVDQPCAHCGRYALDWDAQRLRRTGPNTSRIIGVTQMQSATQPTVREGYCQRVDRSSPKRVLGLVGHESRLPK